MELTTAIIKYLAESFKPIRITASRDDWRKLKYSNSIFGVSVFYDESMLAYQTKEILSQCTNLIFSASFYNYCVHKEYMLHPLTHILSLVNDQSRHDFVIDIYNEQNVPVTFDTKGMIPNRWIRMLADFGLANATIDENSIVTQREINQIWTNRIDSLPKQVIENIGHNFRIIMEQPRMSIRVIRAPVYCIDTDDSEDSVEYEEIYKKRDDDKKLVRERVWGTYDAYATPSAQIFFKKCEKYHSYYCHGEQPYYTLAACGGGISMYYLQNLPWSDLRPLLMSSGNRYHDIRGQDQYSPYKDTPYEEIIVLYEALKKEGAEVTIQSEN